MPGATRAISSAGRSNAASRRSVLRITFLSISCPRAGAIPGSRCARISSTATCGRSRGSDGNSAAPSRSAWGSRPTTPRDTKRSSPGGSLAPTGTSSWARCTGWTAAGSTIPRPLPPASRAKAWRRSTTGTTRCSRRRRARGLFDVLTHFDLPKKHGHRPDGAARSRRGRSDPRGEGSRRRRRDLLGRTAQAGRRGLSGTPPAAPDRRRGHSRDVLLRRARAGGGRLGLRADAGDGPRSGRFRARHVREAAKGSPAAPSPVNHRPIAAKTSAEGRRRRAKVV